MKNNTHRKPVASRKKKKLRRSALQRSGMPAPLPILFAAGCLLIIIAAVAIIVIRSKSSTVQTSGSNQTQVSGTDDPEGISMISSTDSDSSSKLEMTPLPKVPVTLTVSVVGDCTLGTDENFSYDSSLNSYFDSYGADYFLQNVKSIFEADDLTIANMEGTLTELDTRADKQFAFKAPPSYAGILSGSSVEAVTLANNHSKDYGEQSFLDTKEALEKENIVHFGYEETAVMEIKGIKVGLVGIYELYDHLERAQQVKDNIAKVKEEGAQLVIVIFHWGNEKEEVPDTNQMTLGRLAIDEGADLVCGHHPHVLQGTETYKGKQIAYSLGNFCFGGNSAPSDMDSMIFQQTFSIDSNGTVTTEEPNIIPCRISSEYGYNDYCPTPAEGEEAERILSKIEERSSWIPAAETNTENTSQGDE